MQTGAKGMCPIRTQDELRQVCSPWWMLLRKYRIVQQFLGMEAKLTPTTISSDIWNISPFLFKEGPLQDWKNLGMWPAASNQTCLVSSGNSTSVPAFSSISFHSVPFHSTPFPATAFYHIPRHCNSFHMQSLGTYSVPKILCLAPSVQRSTAHS